MEAETHTDGLRDPRKLAISTSLLVSFLMLAGKGTAYVITGSAAIFSDAAESVIHLLATAFVAFSLWYAVRPADPDHPYGHGKMAYFASGFEGGLILIAALTIIYAAVRDLITGPELRELDTGLLILVGLTVINLALGLYLIRTGRTHNSLVLVSNGQHVLTDMWTSLGVLVGVAIVWGTGWVWADPIVAIIMALNIAWMGVRLVQRAYDGLMEKVDDEASEAILAELERAIQVGVIDGYHQVRHRRVNDQVWIEYHLHFPGDLSLDEAHERSHDVEDAIAALFPDDEVTVTAHLEPEYHDEAHPSGHTEPLDPLSGMAASTHS